MKPAWSVVLFTTLAGAAQGLVVTLALAELASLPMHTAFLAQALFSKPLIAANTREFHITGTWGDPKVDKVDRKFGAPVPDIPAPSSSMPSGAPAAAANESPPKP